MSDQGYISLVVLFDLSAAFDTIDHDILIDRLENYTGIQGQALRWFRLEIDRYIGLPIFFPIFKHFTIIGYVKKNIGFELLLFFYIHNYTEYNQQ